MHHDVFEAISSPDITQTKPVLINALAFNHDVNNNAMSAIRNGHISQNRRDPVILWHCTRGVLCFGLFVIFLYYRESSGSVTEVHSFTAYSKVMFTGEMTHPPHSPHSALNFPSHRFLCESVSRARKDSIERKKERVESSFFILG